MNEQITELLNASLGAFSLAGVFAALITLLLCLAVIRILMRVAEKLLEKSPLEARIKRMILTALRSALYVLTVLMVVDSLGIPTTSLVAFLSVLSLAISLALQNVLANVAGGMVVIASQPFQMGDYIECSAGNGTVVEITLNNTKLETFSGQRIVIPNSILTSTQITNFSTLPTRRIAHSLCVAYAEDVDTVKAVCQEALQNTPNLLPDPAPQVVLDNYNEAGVQYTVRCWVKQEHYWDSYYALSEQLKRSCQRHGLHLSARQVNVHIAEK